LIQDIDGAAARAMPGVSGIFTAADLDADGIGTLPCIARVARPDRQLSCGGGLKRSLNCGWGLLVV
jgi:hypothetical protein